MPHAEFIACHGCDALQRTPALDQGTVACRRCGAVLYRTHSNSLDMALALVLTSLTLFVIANVYPIVGLDVQGTVAATSLGRAVAVLWSQGAQPVAALVFVTTILVPAIELGAMLYLLLPLKLGVAPRHGNAMLRIVASTRPWGMIEVLILGIMVSLVKLAHIAHVIPGVALWAYAALVLSLATLGAVFNARDAWTRLCAAS
jgi:paraquat-inducible protein A